jgi:hypothetical protein
MMKKLMVAVLAGILLATSAATARVVTYEGACTGGLAGNWRIVIVIDDNTGEVSRREGTNCNGTHWVGNCNVSIGNLGTTSGYYEERVETSMWWVRCNVNASGIITDMWGKRSDGTFWVMSDNDTALK